MTRLNWAEVRGAADRIGTEVCNAFPGSRFEMTESRPELVMALVQFEPPSARGVAPLVMVNADASVEVSVDGSEVEPYYSDDPNDIDSLVTHAVERVLALARNGAIRVRVPSFLGPMAASHVGIPGLDHNVDLAIASRFSKIDKEWTRW